MLLSKNKGTTIDSIVGPLIHWQLGNISNETIQICVKYTWL